jgi:uncharacterized protein (TIGR02118 family)
MHKLVILIEQSEEWQAVEDAWPEFLRRVEEMPGLRREATSRVVQSLFGNSSYTKMHELFFDTLPDVERAMASPQGREAGRLLQRMTGGHLTLFFAEHKEDDLENILKSRHGESKTSHA